MARYANILETIGNTPLVRLNKLAPAGVNIYVKIESFNPIVVSPPFEASRIRQLTELL